VTSTFAGASAKEIRAAIDDIARAIKAIRGLDEMPSREVAMRHMIQFLDGLMDQLVAAGVCPERPELRGDQQLGLYPCPFCSCMVLAGEPHSPHDQGCALGLDGFGIWR